MKAYKELGPRQKTNVAKPEDLRYASRGFARLRNADTFVIQNAEDGDTGATTTYYEVCANVLGNHYRRGIGHRDNRNRTGDELLDTTNDSGDWGKRDTDRPEPRYHRRSEHGQRGPRDAKP